ncbi:MAG: 50S ribosomal protein L17 [Chlamydiales bacterium]|nr:50S ribosomal protein L17 [Chlamydiales bacterium]
MRHAKRTCKLGRTSSHKRCLMANMLKSLIEHGQIETTIVKAKELRRYADKVVTLAKKNTLASKRDIQAKLMVRYNALTPKETRAAKGGDTSAYNGDRKVVGILVNDLAPRYTSRDGGYTRIIRLSNRVGDGAEKCIIEYIK